ncbi:NAD(P)/FAD-dependent oxidoreductase [Candidatus Woesearchaeota archaeon]|nr:NAD(P)/FAD-dependent oxidoreductase [Candidatus Woesearchaeota archaeon]
MIAVVGAGPAGSYAAYLLAKQGYEVKLFEEHKEIGSPIQCTGILTEGIKTFFTPKKEVITTTISRIKVHSQKEQVEFKLQKPDIIVDRTLFDQSLAAMAHDAGAEVLPWHRFEKKEQGKIIIEDIKNKTKKAYAPSHLIGADGPNSHVAKSDHMKGKRTFFYGAQATIKGTFDPECYEVYLGSVCPDLFAWVVPENEHYARAGLASFSHPHTYFQAFLKKLGSPSICACQGGLIPLYNRTIETEKEHTFLVGDAAFQVKATTAGGIIQGITAAKALEEAITKNQSYEQLWKKALQRDLWLHLLIRKAMNRFADKDYDYLLHLVQQQRMKKIIEEFPRDYPSRFMTSLALREPRLAYFAKFLMGR